MCWLDQSIVQNLSLRTRSQPTESERQEITRFSDPKIFCLFDDLDEKKNEGFRTADGWFKLVHIPL